MIKFIFMTKGGGGGGGAPKSFRHSKGGALKKLLGAPKI